jgi:type II secretory pathway component PulC
MKKIFYLKTILMFFISLSNSSIADERTLLVDPFSKDLTIIKKFRKNLSQPSVYPVTSMQLVGTIVGNNTENYALVKLPGDVDQVVIKQGQQIGKYKALVKKIDTDRVIIEENNSIITLGLNE